MEKNFTMIPNAVDDDGLSLYAARLYWALKRYGNIERDNEYLAYPNLETIAKKCKMSVDKVSDATDELVKAGWIRDITKWKNNVNVYHLNTKKCINQNLVKQRAEQKKKHRKITLITNTFKSYKNYKNGENNNQNDVISRPQPQPESDKGVTRSQPLTVTAENGKNNTNLTTLKIPPVISPVSLETGEKFTDFPETLWLLNMIWKQGLLKTTPPSSKENLKEYKRWQSQMKELVALGTKEELVKTIQRGIFYDDFQVDEPAQIYRTLRNKLEEYRHEKTAREEYSRNFVKPIPWAEEKNIVPKEEAVRILDNLLLEDKR
jgi:hypothetical protein